ncbi:scavenger receptor cysteine-rich domain superfamily protein-like, partial [Saccoglossus kowalevskii]
MDDCCPAYDASHGPLWGDMVQCTGTEHSVRNCWHSTTADSGLMAAGVNCIDPEVRLNGHTPYQGRLEVKLNGEWGTVCDDGFYDSEVVWCVDSLVCSPCNWFSLGLTTIPRRAYYSGGTGHIWMEQQYCFGHEPNVAYCPSIRTTSTSRCGHNRDVGIVCNALLRLVGGPSPRQGRLEVYKDEWGRVCDTDWDNDDATVVCKELGFPGMDPSLNKNDLFIPNGPGPILLNNLECSGTEKSIMECPAETSGVQTCNDVLIGCSDNVRMVDGISYFDGRVEVYHNGQWGLVCNSGFDENDANVVCKELGFPLGVKVILPPGLFGVQTKPVWMTNVDCQGEEQSIFECPPCPPLDARRCTVSDNTNIECKPPFQFVGGRLPYEGRVDVYHQGQWGTICDTNWDNRDAEVICRELGFPFGGVAYPSAHYGQGSGQIWYENVQCDGTENSIISCPKATSGSTSCTHAQDASAACAAPVRLFGGPSHNEGRLQVYRNGTWGYICDDYFDVIEANIVCKELSFAYGSQQHFHKSYYGTDSAPIWADDMGCQGREQSIMQCEFSLIHNCDHGETVGLKCF